MGYNAVDPLRDAHVIHAIRDAEAALNGSGRLLIRPSGTEKVIRVMAEGENEGLVIRLVDELCQVITQVGH